MSKLNTENLDTWAIIKVGCDDGQERVGMILEGCEDLTEERVIERGLHEEMASAMVSHHAKELNMEQFDNDIHEPIEY